MKKLIKLVGGGLTGFVNGLLGSGGGMVAVPVLRSAGFDTRTAHSSALAVVLPITVVSASLYLTGGNVTFSDALPYIPGGAVGAVIGGLIMPRISPDLLRRIFGGFAIWAGIRMLLQ